MLQFFCYSSTTPLKNILFLLLLGFLFSHEVAASTRSLDEIDVEMEAETTKKSCHISQIKSLGLALHGSVTSSNNKELAFLLVTKGILQSDANLNVKISGNPLLYTACIHQNLEAVALLLAFGASAATVSDETTLNALEASIQSKNKFLIAMILHYYKPTHLALDPELVITTEEWLRVIGIPINEYVPNLLRHYLD